jgi:hypothetical protein
MALLAACITPYGPESIAVTYRILRLGQALSIIGEWQPQDFGRFDGFEACLLLALAFALYRGVTLPPLRILVLLGLLHLALSHVRNAEILGLLGPIFLAQPLACRFGSPATDTSIAGSQPRAVANAVVVTILAALTWALATTSAWTPRAQISPAGAVQAIKARNAGAIFNDYDFGGYLIYAGLKPFIDGRTELYGEAFTARHHRAVTLRNVDDFVRLLDEQRIAVTLLAPATPAVGLLDRMSGWERAYVDDVAVVHVRRGAAGN